MGPLDTSTVGDAGQGRAWFSDVTTTPLAVMTMECGDHPVDKLPAQERAP